MEPTVVVEVSGEEYRAALGPDLRLARVSRPCIPASTMNARTCAGEAQSVSACTAHLLLRSEERLPSVGLGRKTAVVPITQGDLA